MERFVSKRLSRMLAWMDANQPAIYASYDDSVSDDMAQALLEGRFDDFEMEWAEWEWNAADYIDWSEWESEFADEFGYESFDDMPERIQDLARENRTYDASDYLRGCLRGWSGHVVARLCKRNGEYVEFPNYYNDSATNRRLQSYLKRQCGINGMRADASYPGTYLSVLGSVDLWELYQSHKKPEWLWVDSDCFTIGHEPMNGSGTMSDDKWTGPKRKMRAEFFVDGRRGYGVDDIYGFVGSVWRHELAIA